MEALRALTETVPPWLTGYIAPLLALIAGYLAARFIHTRADRRPTDLAETEASWRTRLLDAQEHAELLDQENQHLESVLQERDKEVASLTARMSGAAARDREELVRLQEELESDHRAGLEKARLIRSAEAASHRAQSEFRQTRFNRERQRVSLCALQAALTHAKRAQASTDERLARLREQLGQAKTELVQTKTELIQARSDLDQARSAAGREREFQADQHAVTERVVERIIEIPVEKIVYRDREVPVEVPIEVPVGFTAFPAPPAGKGLRPRYSENRPSSA